jgi:cysteine desulfurase family protein (TIGR01976 family)
MDDLHGVRAGFPALERRLNGEPAAYLDGPGGTQAHRSVIDAIAGLLERGSSNLHGPFITSHETDRVVDESRSAVADLYGSSPEEIVFGQNMTSLTYAMSRALARTWKEGDTVVVTRLDHDANVTPWVQAAADVGAVVEFVDFDPDSGCMLDERSLERALDARPRLVAFTHASNAVGTITPAARVVEAAHAVGALTYVDAVHFAPHGSIDVRALDTDFLVSSAYKWFGPHTGCLYGKRSVLEDLVPYKLRPSPDTAPERWETGTQSFESLVGVAAAVDYLSSLGSGDTRRARLVDAYGAIADHERRLSTRFLAGIAEMPRVRLAGDTDVDHRTPTFAIEVDGIEPAVVAAELARHGIFVWSGDYYAVEVMRRLGRADHGMVRVGFVHYNTIDEVDRVLDALARW